jgi:predicted nucleic acid-binding protein
MASPDSYLIDTNILLRVYRTSDPQHPPIDSAIQILESAGTDLYFCLQNIAEFWNVCTRPIERNGFGLTLVETDDCVENIEHRMIFLPDSDLVYTNWRRLLTTHGIRGVQVHDARLVAIMQAYGLTRILTLNKGDFERFPGITPVHPSDVVAKPV